MGSTDIEAGWKTILYALSLEAVFLAFCVVLIGLGLSEIKRKKSESKNISLIILGICLSLMSFYVTHLFIKG